MATGLRQTPSSGRALGTCGETGSPPRAGRAVASCPAVSRVSLLPKQLDSTGRGCARGDRPPPLLCPLWTSLLGHDGVGVGMDSAARQPGWTSATLRRMDCGSRRVTPPTSVTRSAECDAEVARPDVGGRGCRDCFRSVSPDAQRSVGVSRWQCRASREGQLPSAQRPGLVRKQGTLAASVSHPRPFSAPPASGKQSVPFFSLRARGSGPHRGSQPPGPSAGIPLADKASA